jgi:hypothetical protein
VLDSLATIDHTGYAHRVVNGPRKRLQMRRTCTTQPPLLLKGASLASIAGRAALDYLVANLYVLGYCILLVQYITILLYAGFVYAHSMIARFALDYTAL